MTVLSALSTRSRNGTTTGMPISGACGPGKNRESFDEWGMEISRWAINKERNCCTQENTLIALSRQKGFSRFISIPKNAERLARKRRPPPDPAAELPHQPTPPSINKEGSPVSNEESWPTEE